MMNETTHVEGNEKWSLLDGRDENVLNPSEGGEA